MKSKLLIVFSDEWLSYSPTILNLVASLSDSFEIKVISFDIGEFKNNELTQKEFEFIKINYFAFNIMLKLKIYKYIKVLLLLIKLWEYKADEVIAVDALALWVAQKIFKKCHFLSLEVEQNRFFKACKIELIKSVLIQTEERYRYLFKDADIKTFYVQNSPRFKKASIMYGKRRAKKAIYFGNVIPSHGIFQCIEGITCLPDISLTITGIMKSKIKKQITDEYEGLIQQQRILINETYISQEEVIEYLSQFSIGFCFYNFNLIANNDFNYISCPSGKLFNYYAAGVPVIGSDILGLKSVEEFQTGILLKELSAENIARAVKTILSNYQEYSQNCIRAAKYFDFDSSVEPYKNYLLDKVGLTVSTSR